MMARLRIIFIFLFTFCLTFKFVCNACISFMVQNSIALKTMLNEYSNFWTAVLRKIRFCSPLAACFWCPFSSPVPPAYGQQLDWETYRLVCISLFHSHTQVHTHTHTRSEDILGCPSRVYFLSFVLNNLNGAEESYSFPWADIKRLSEPCNELLSSISIMTKYPLLNYSFIQQIILSAC